METEQLVCSMTMKVPSEKRSVLSLRRSDLKPGFFCWTDRYVGKARKKTTLTETPVPAWGMDTKDRRLNDQLLKPQDSGKLHGCPKSDSAGEKDTLKLTFSEPLEANILTWDELSLSQAISRTPKR